MEMIFNISMQIKEKNIILKFEHLNIKSNEWIS